MKTSTPSRPSRHISACGLTAMLSALALVTGAASVHASPIPAGQKSLNLFAGGIYNNNHDPQHRFWVEHVPYDVSHSVSWLDTTGGRTDQAWAGGSVTATTISLYSRSYAHHPAYSPTSNWAFGQAYAAADVRTPFRVQSGAATGQGTLVVPLHVSGSVELGPAILDQTNWAQAEGAAYMYFWATGLNASGCSYHTTAGCWAIDHVVKSTPGGGVYFDTVTDSNNPIRTWTLHIPFDFGSWNDFYLQMWTGAESKVQPGYNAQVGISHYAESDFAHTLRWGGVSAVLDANGQPVSDWNIESLPGVNLRVSALPAGAVPEPGTFALLLAGLGVMGWLLARRRHHAG